MRTLALAWLVCAQAMSGREAIRYWTAVYKGEAPPTLHTHYPLQRDIERRLQAVDAKAAGAADDDELDDDGFTKRDAYAAMWTFYWIVFSLWCVTGGPVLVVSVFWYFRGNAPWGVGKVGQEPVEEGDGGAPAGAEEAKE